MRSRERSTRTDGERMHIRVVIVDDFPLVRRGIADALNAEAAISVVGEAAGVSSGLEVVHATEPDVVVADLKLADGSGIELVERLGADAPGLPVLVLTAIEKLDTMHQVAAAGARGYLTKRVKAAELQDAIVTIYGGGTFFEARSAADFARAYPEIAATESNPTALLSAREREVLGLVGRGLTDREVSERLALSIRTVQNHLAAIRRKTGLRRRSELASWAIRHSVD